MAERYNFSLTTFSPSGKLAQIEYALAAVQKGTTSIGIKASNGAVLITERKATTPLIDADTLERISPICNGIGAVYSGMGPDARVLVLKARKAAMAYQKQHGRPPPVRAVVMDVAKVMQEYTQSGGVRPFGVSLLIIGQDVDQTPALYQVDPSGAFYAWSATAIGKNSPATRSFLEKRYVAAKDSESLFELEDAVHLGVLALKEGFEGQMTSDNVQVATLDNSGFQILSPHAVSDYLSTG
jgi:20S proteasome subunit alpha 2